MVAERTLLRTEDHRGEPIAEKATSPSPALAPVDPEKFQEYVEAIARYDSDNPEDVLAMQALKREMLGVE